MKNTHEWCAKGVKPKINNLKNLSTANFPWWMEQLRKEENIHIKNVSKMPGKAKSKKITGKDKLKTIRVTTNSLY